MLNPVYTHTHTHTYIYRNLSWWTYFIPKFFLATDLFKNWNNAVSGRLGQLFSCTLFASAVIHVHSIFIGLIHALELWTFVWSHFSLKVLGQTLNYSTWESFDYWCSILCVCIYIYMLPTHYLFANPIYIYIYKSWRQHYTRHQLYGHLPLITKTIQVRWTRHAEHCWRSRDELISDVLLWSPTYGRAKAGWPARTYIQQLCEDTGCSPEDLNDER